MKKLEKILNDNGPDDVFIFYSFLLCNRKNQILVNNKNELRKVFLSESKSINEKFKHLHKHIKKDIKKDLLKSYLYIKSNYFRKGVDSVCKT